jgi:hypothetical protein
MPQIPLSAVLAVALVIAVFAFGNYPVSEPLYPVAYSGLVHGCVKNGGHWLSSHTECENVSADWCLDVSGNFEQCASACRHSGDALAPCTMQCVPVCGFGEPSAALSTLTPGDATFLIDGQPIRFQDGYALEELVPGQAVKSEARIWGISPPGDLNGDRWPDVGVVIVHDRGGLGQYYYLAAATGAPQLYVGSEAVLVGKDVRPGTLAIKDRQLTLNYGAHYPWQDTSERAPVGKSKVVSLDDNGGLIELERPQLDQETALELASDTWGDCEATECDALTVRVLDGQDGVWYVEATYEGLRDDSVEAVRRSASVHYASGRWLVGSVLLTEYRCQRGRGQSDFGKGLCL